MMHPNTLIDLLAAQFAQDSLDILNQTGPFGGRVPESERITMTHEEKVDYGRYLASKDVLV